MAKFTVIYAPNAPEKGCELIVHRTGCQHIALKMKHATSNWEVEAASADQAIRIDIKDQYDGSGGDFDFSRSDYHVANCANENHRTIPAFLDR